MVSQNNHFFKYADYVNILVINLDLSAINLTNNHVNITVNYHPTSVRVSVIKKTKNILTIGKDVEKTKLLAIVGENEKQYSCWGNDTDLP